MRTIIIFRSSSPGCFLTLQPNYIRDMNAVGGRGGVGGEAEPTGSLAHPHEAPKVAPKTSQDFRSQVKKH